MSVKKKPSSEFWRAIRKVGPSTPTGVLQTWSMPISALQQLTGRTRATILTHAQKGAPSWFPWRDIQIDLDKTTILFAIPETARANGEKIANLCAGIISFTCPVIGGGKPNNAPLQFQIPSILSKKSLAFF